jgi:phosphoserine phosphatase
MINKETMNIYDFDGTIYQGDSSVEFYFFELRRHPKILKRFFSLFMHFLGFNSGDFTYEELKSNLWSYIKDIDLEKEVEAFWNKKEKKIGEWYLKRKRPDDIIISASPDFLVKQIADKLGVRCIATNVDTFTGEVKEDCSKEGKITYLKKSGLLSSLGDIDEFYSDSDEDRYLAKLPKHPYKITSKGIKPWQIKKD